MKVDINFIKEDLKGRISNSRYQHSLQVMETAVKLAAFWGAPQEKCRLAGLVHDCGKHPDISKIFELCDFYGVELTEEDRNNPNVVHAFLGARLAHELYGIDDPEILDAIRYHTTGAENMSLVSKIIFLADYIEPGRIGRQFDDVRQEAYRDLDRALLKAYDYNIQKLLRYGEEIHPLTILGRNDIIRRLRQAAKDKHKEADE